MYLSSIRVQELQSWKDSGIVEFSPGVNVVVGKNNSGKTSLFNAILRLQHKPILGHQMLRIGSKDSSLEYNFKDVTESDFSKVFGRIGASTSNRNIKCVSAVSRSGPSSLNCSWHGMDWNLESFQNSRPGFFIQPFFSQRSIQQAESTLSGGNAALISENYQNLVSLIDPLCKPADKRHDQFATLVKDITGVDISVFAFGSGGPQLALHVDEDDYIPAKLMGDGIAHAVAFAAALVKESGKLFLIDQIEKDLHPSALKKIMEQIRKVANKNQFIISTHSQTVVKFLGSIPESAVHQVTMEVQNGIPVSSIRRVNDTTEERLEVLYDLGYDSIDIAHPEGYLFFEESSAEGLVKKFLIPWFVPELTNRVSTVACNGADRCINVFEGFVTTFIFLHLKRIYNGKVWVRLDGDDAGAKAVAKAREKFSSWPERTFETLTKSDFEYYLPERFRAESAVALSASKADKRDLKKALWEKVTTWCNDEPAQAKLELKESAADVIKMLRDFESNLKAGD